MYYGDEHEKCTNEGGIYLDQKQITQKLIELRGEKPREEVAKACNISVSALAMYEQGNRVPRDDIKIRLANYYGKPVGFIFYAE